MYYEKAKAAKQLFFRSKKENLKKRPPSTKADDKPVTKKFRRFEIIETCFNDFKMLPKWNGGSSLGLHSQGRNKTKLNQTHIPPLTTLKGGRDFIL